MLGGIPGPHLRQTKCIRQSMLGRAGSIKAWLRTCKGHSIGLKTRVFPTRPIDPAGKAIPAFFCGLPTHNVLAPDRPLSYRRAGPTTRFIHKSCDKVSL